MPRLRRLPKKRLTSWSADQIHHLRTGHGIWREDAFCSDDLMRQAWGDLGDEILEAWIVEHPGTRPAAWWAFDAPGRRERTDGRAHPFDDPLRRGQVATWRKKYGETSAERLCTLSFGCPAMFINLDDSRAEYESEGAFLRRHNLLTTTEQR